MKRDLLDASLVLESTADSAIYHWFENVTKKSEEPAEHKIDGRQLLALFGIDSFDPTKDTTNRKASSWQASRWWCFATVQQPDGAIVS